MAGLQAVEAGAEVFQNLAMVEDQILGECIEREEPGARGIVSRCDIAVRNRDEHRAHGRKARIAARAGVGVHLHGAAADALVAQGTGPVGLTASELIDAARRQWNAWLANP